MTGALDRPVCITVFPDLEARSRESQFTSLLDFSERLATQRAPSKGELPLFSCCSYDDRRTAKGSLRSDGNVRECFALVGDYDGGRTSLHEAADALRQVGVAGLVVATPGHTPAAPRFRVIAPLHNPLHRKRGLTDYQKLINRLAGIFPDGLASESWTLSQSWYIGTIDGAPDHTVLAIDGDFIDERPDLDASARSKPSKAPNGQPPHPSVDETDEAVPLDIADALAAIAAGNGSHTALVSLAGKFASQAVPMTTAEAVILNAIDQRPAAGRDDGWWKMRGDVGRTVRWAYQKFAEGEERYLRLLTSAPHSARGGNGATPPPPPGSSPGTAPGAPPPPPGGPGTSTPAIAPIRFSENALALLFTAEHADNLLYVHEWGRWMRWRDGRWREDPTVAVFDAARVICADEGNTALKLLRRTGSKVATAINKAATVAAVERLARHHAPHVRPAMLFDADGLALNTPDCALDLRDLITPDRTHSRTDYMTRSTTVTPAATAHCPIWIGFLYRIMGDRPEMVRYLQRVCGYMLTGSVKEHVLFFAHGTGANGKSTLANVLLGVLGVGPDGYAAVAPISTFTASRTDQHPTDLAMLRGVRLVVAHETEEGRSWAISKLKMMTGEDLISARFMRQDFFTYAPQFKLLILGNHKPALRGVDEATRRRFHLIPFDVTIPAAERDLKLGEKLRGEYAAILRWAIEGCADWIQNGLQPPQSVVAATEAYLADEDTFTAWRDECCRVGPRERDTLINLFASWKSWCEANGEYVGRRRELAKQFDIRGYARYRDDISRHQGWRGIRVLASWERP